MSCFAPGEVSRVGLWQQRIPVSAEHFSILMLCRVVELLGRLRKWLSQHFICMF